MTFYGLVVQHNITSPFSQEFVTSMLRTVSRIEAIGQSAGACLSLPHMRRCTVEVLRAEIRKHTMEQNKKIKHIIMYDISSKMIVVPV